MTEHDEPVVTISQVHFASLQQAEKDLQAVRDFLGADYLKRILDGTTGGAHE